jgi:hypothetical protein
LINIDVDMMEQKNLNIDAIVTKLMEIWKSDPVNNFKTLFCILLNLFCHIFAPNNYITPQFVKWR